jgi:hydroxyethylthiazole kinase-like uncharacterized protein yjeF
MKEYVLTNQEARQVDHYTMDKLGIPGINLMKRAGNFVSLQTKKMLKDVPGSQVDIFCGMGNNGGDGFVAARDLADWGASVNIWLAGDPTKIKGDALHYFKRCSTNRITIKPILSPAETPSLTQIAHADLIIDALLGTGFKGEVKGVIKELIELINAVKRPVLAVDIPSGIQGDTAQIGGVAVQATKTVTMGFLKRGLLFQPGKRMAGEVVIADLDYPEEAFTILEKETFLIDQNIVNPLFPVIYDNTYKHKQGKVLIFAGSPGMTGAAVLTAVACLRSGAGLVVNAIPKSLNPIIEIKTTETLSLPLPESAQQSFCPESLTGARERVEWSDVIVFGPGVSARPEVREFGLALLKLHSKPMVIDADGLRIFHDNLTLINDLPDLILTPHVGEFAMLSKIDMKTILMNPVDVARDFVDKYRCTLVLKGAPTIVVSPESQVGINSTGNPALATGGTGDVLTGMIAGFRAQGMNSFDTATAAVFLHGIAGDLGREEYGVRGLIAGDLLQLIPGILKNFEKVV